MAHCIKLSLLCFVLILTAVTAQAEDAPPVQTFTLKEHLDHDWSQELVFFEIEPEAAEALRTGRAALFGPDDHRVAWQLSTRNGKPAIAFMADLPAGTSRMWKVTWAEAEALENPLAVEETEQVIRVLNPLVGLEVPKAMGDAPTGPIRRIRLRSGQWMAASRLESRLQLTSYEASILDQGPVFVDIRCRYTFEGGKRWTVGLRVITGEPVIFIDESFDLGGGSRWRMILNRDFPADRVAYRNCSPQRGDPQNANLVRPIRKDVLSRQFLLCPWLLWWMPDAVSFMTLFPAEKGVEYVYDPARRATVRMKEKRPAEPLQGTLTVDPEIARATADEKKEEPKDALFVAAGHAGDWAGPGQNGMGKCVPLQMNKGGDLFLNLQLDGPGRKWVIGSSTLADTLVPDSELSEAQRNLIKYCETPLQLVNEMVLDWTALTHEQYKRLLTSEEDVTDVCKRLEGNMPGHPYAGKYYYGFLCNPTEKLKQELRENVMGGLRHGVEVFTEHIESRGREGGPIRRPSGPAYNHHVTMRVMAALITTDLVFGTDLFTDHERKRIYGKLGFLAYKIGSPDFYSLERNWRANPNMTTMRHSVIGLMGCMMPEHPKSRGWFKLGVSEIQRQIERWIGPNGGWLECPHYQTLISEALTMLLAADRVGYSELLYDKRLLSTIVYLAKTCTPPDPRFHNLRTFSPIGNTYRMETSAIFGIFAKLHRKRNPREAAALQWMWQQHGRPTWLAIGGNTGMNQYTHFLLDPTWSPDAPDWKSEVFPLSGTVLRGGFPGPRETQLYMLQGPFNQHYDSDRGSISLWGKGRPLSLDWGYAGRMPRDMHNMMSIGNNGRVVGFNTQDRLDWVHCNLGPWQRLILFVKDETAGGPNYFLLRDETKKGPGNASWYFWLYTDKPVRREGDVLHMEGHHDVNLDVWLADGRARSFPRLTAEELKVESGPKLQQDLGIGGGVVEDEDLLVEKAKDGPDYIRTRKESVTVVQGKLNPFGWSYQALKQRGLTLTIPRGEHVFSVLYPRLKTERPATFEAIADGHGVRVSSPVGVDYAFLSGEPIKFAEGDVVFEGTAGAIQVRGKKVTLSLGAAGMIRYGEKVLRR